MIGAHAIDIALCVEKREMMIIGLEAVVHIMVVKPQLVVIVSVSVSLNVLL